MNEMTNDGCYTSPVQYPAIYWATTLVVLAQYARGTGPVCSWYWPSMLMVLVLAQYAHGTGPVHHSDARGTEMCFTNIKMLEDTGICGAYKRHSCWDFYFD